jgi:protein TonB
MEPKKNPKYDIHRSRAIIFNVSLAISLLLVITAFNWSVETDKRTVCKGTEISQHIELAAIPVIYEKKKEVSAPKPIKTSKPTPQLQSIDIKVVNDGKAIEEPQGVIDQNHNPMIEIPFTAVDIPEEKTETVFRVVEKMPEPVGGWQTFFKTLQKHLKYPTVARRTNAAGKVFVEFIVNESGELQDLSIIKGIGFGCDEEAMRVIALTKWNPGKQRGRPVKVRLVQPVVFSLGTP